MQCRKKRQAEWGVRALLSVGDTGRPGEVTCSRDLKGVREGRKPMSRGGCSRRRPQLSRGGGGSMLRQEQR